MAFGLVISNRMINSFQNCTRTKDFHPFLNDYQDFLSLLGDYTRRVVFPDDVLCKTICQKQQLLFSYLTKWNSSDTVEKTGFEKLSADLEKTIPKFVESLKLAIATNNWARFYQQCRPIADRIIHEARRQKVFDLEICYELGRYDSFESLENAIIPREQKSAAVNHPPIKTSPSTLQSTNEQPNSSENLSKLVENLFRIEFSKLKDVIEKEADRSCDFLEQKMDDTRTRLTLSMADNAEKMEQISVKIQSLEKEIQGDERNMEGKTMKASETAEKMAQEEDDKMTAKIENLFTKLQKNYDEMKAESMKMSEQKLEELVANISINIQEQERKMKSREEKLDKKMEDIKIREESLYRKLEEMIKVTKEGFREQEQQQSKTTEPDRSDRNFSGSGTPYRKCTCPAVNNMHNHGVYSASDSTDDYDDPYDFSGPMNPNRNSDRSYSTRDRKYSPRDRSCSTSDRRLYDYIAESQPHYDPMEDVELRKIQEDFDKKLAEQKERHAAEMKEVTERGRQKNEKAQDEISALSRSLSRGASFRS